MSEEHERAKTLEGISKTFSNSYFVYDFAEEKEASNLRELVLGLNMTMTRTKFTP